MKKLIIALTFSLALTACGGTNNPVNTSSNVDPAMNISSRLNIQADGTTANALPAGTGKGMGKMKGGFKGPFGGVDLGLTDDQKAQFKALADAEKASHQAQAKPDMTKMKANMQALKDAFLADKIDKATLKALFDASKPAKDDSRLDAQANNLIKSYNILTSEQRQKLEDARTQMEAKVKPAPDASMLQKMKDAQAKKFDQMAASLGLNDAQKEALKALTQPTDAPDMQAGMAKRKAAHDAVQAALKSGTATVESIKALLAPDTTDFSAKQDARLDKIVKLHDLLNADQRKKVVGMILQHGGGHRGVHGGFGGFGGGQFGKGGPGGFAPGGEGHGKGMGGFPGFPGKGGFGKGVKAP